jgi:hypothetical protein
MRSSSRSAPASTMPRSGRLTGLPVVYVRSVLRTPY